MGFVGEIKNIWREIETRKTGREGELKVRTADCNTRDLFN